MTSHAVMPEMLVDDRISIPACRLLHQVHTQPEWSSIVILIDYPIISISLQLYNTHVRSYGNDQPAVVGYAYPPIAAMRRQRISH